MNRRSGGMAMACVLVLACNNGQRKRHEPDWVPAPPGACPADRPRNQSPVVFGPAGIEPEAAETCEADGTGWTPCHQHMHCGAEHSGKGICGGADCEVHTVYRMRKDGKPAAAVADLHAGSVPGNCQPAEHHLLVRATFLDFAADCAADGGASLTYCGSATGNSAQDADHDGTVTCSESGLNAVPVRWCIQTVCDCRPGSTAAAQVANFGEIQVPRVQGCPNLAP